MPTYQAKLKPIATSTAGYATKLKPIGVPPAPAPAEKTYSQTPLGAAQRAGDTIADAFKGGLAQANQGAADTRAATNPVSKLEGLLKFGAGVASAVVSPFAPVFAPVGALINKAGEGYASLKPVQDFASSKDGETAMRVAEGLQNAGIIAGTALGGRSIATKTSNYLSQPKATPATTPTPPKPTAPKIVQKRVSELQKIENNNAPVRRVIEKSKAQGIDSKQLLAETDLLRGSVDNSGTIRTKAAMSELNDFLKPHETVISANLAREGVQLPLAKVADRLRRSIDDSGLEADALELAHSKLNMALKGLERRADPNGNISLSKIHEAKVSKYATVDYLNPAAKVADKAIARTFKQLVEEHTKSVEVRALNKELARHYAVLDLLEKLDGKKVAGGRLGKYFAQTVGAVAGSHFGPLGTIVGAELGGRIRGGMMQSTFRGTTGQNLKTSEAMNRAVAQSKAPPLALPAPKEGTPAKSNYTPIPLRGRVVDEPQAPTYSKSLGKRNQAQTPTMTTTKKVSIPPKDSTALGKAKDVFNTIKREGKRGFVKLPFGGKKLSNIHPDDIHAMELFITQARKGAFEVTDNVYASAEKLAEKFGISMDLSPGRIASEFEKILTGTRAAPDTVVAPQARDALGRFK